MHELLSMLLGSAPLSALSAALGAWATSRLLKRKYQAEIDGLRAEVEERLSNVKSNELDNVRKANDILVESIVEPLKKEIKSLRTDVNRFRKAIEKIPGCDLADRCPVSRELQQQETLDAADDRGSTAVR